MHQIAQSLGYMGGYGEQGAGRAPSKPIMADRSGPVGSVLLALPVKF